MKKDKKTTESHIQYMNYINRENNYHHPYYDEDMKQFYLMQAGDMVAVDESQKMMKENNRGRLSDDPTTDMKYLFVACITLTSRFAIEGGMDSETSLNSSDYFIRKLSDCKSIEEVLQLHKEMMNYYTKHMANVRKDRVFSKPIVQCMDYIETHLHTQIRIADLAEIVGLNQNYLSVLFKKETGETFTDYVLERRISTAKKMLSYSHYSMSYISEVLCFSSQSHFIRVFKKYEGITPKEYRNRYFSG